MNDPLVRKLFRHIEETVKDHASLAAGTSSDLSQDCVKVVFHRQRFSSFLTGRDELVAPITFEVWPSLTCDARCPLCTYSLNAARKDADRRPDLQLADLDIYSRTLSLLASGGVHSVIFTGGGEPTLHPHLDKLVSCARANGLKWGLFTHGMNLSASLAEKLLAGEPRFLRVSVNRGSSAGHEREYRLGPDSYSRVRKGVIATASLAGSAGRRCVGLGYALDGSITDAELDGISAFVTDVVEATHGGVAFVAFRPKIVYYRRNGTPYWPQPHAQELLTLPSRINERVVRILEARFPETLRIDHKEAMFWRAASPSPPRRHQAVSLGWAGQIDHLGNGYVTSELNGSPWENTCYGSFATARDFDELWHSPRRRGLFGLFLKGANPLPIHHKLSHVEEFLSGVRSRFGVLSEQQVSGFYHLVDDADWPKPSNWDFL